MMIEMSSAGKPNRVSFGNPLEGAFLTDDDSVEAGMRVATFEGTMTRLVDGLL